MAGTENMHEKMWLHLEEKQYHDIIARYHFSPDDLTQIKQVGTLTEKTVAPEIYYKIPEDGKRIPVIVTLGKEIDVLQERYLLRERITECYMIECIAMELLKNAYEHAAEYIHASTGLWISGFAFLGDQVPLDDMEEIFRCLKPQGISYNRAYMMTPKKTVVFFADLCAQPRDSDCRICEACSNLSCPNRLDGTNQDKRQQGAECQTETARPMTDETGRKIEPKRRLTYGYQRIFGRADRE